MYCILKRRIYSLVKNKSNKLTYSILKIGFKRKELSVGWFTQKKIIKIYFCSIINKIYNGKYKEYYTDQIDLGKCYQFESKKKFLNGIIFKHKSGKKIVSFFNNNKHGRIIDKYNVFREFCFNGEIILKLLPV